MRRGAVLLALLAAGCSSRAPAPPTTQEARHVVLVTIDTLRADRLGCYGSRTVETPRLDAIARDGAMAPRSTAGVPLTRPSHVSLFTGLYPAESGIRDNVSASLDPARVTLAQVLRGAGFHTAGFVSSIVLSAQSGLDRGFETYDDAFQAGEDDARFLNSIQKRGDETTAAAVGWLEGHREGRLFLWVHLYDPHDPYEPPEPYASRYADRPYDGEVAWTDELVGRLDDALVRLGLRDDTLLVVTSDHGEGLGEHGEPTHGFFLYQSTLAVPLLFRGPGIAPGTRIPVTARTVDLFPTILDLAGVARPEGLTLAGRSLAGALRGRERPREEAAYAESLLPLVHFGWSDLRMLREGRYKYIQAPRPELYDLEDDPGETRNLVASQEARAAALRGELQRRLAAEVKERGTKPVGNDVPADLLEKLGALGYLGAGTVPSGGSPGADPKDKIEEYKVVNRLVREALVRLRQKDYAGSVERFRELHRRGIDSFEVHYYLARGLVGLGKRREAIPEFEAALARLPGFSAAYLAIADCRTALGDSKGALAALERGQKAAPRDPRLYDASARISKNLGRSTDALRDWEEVARLAPKDALVRVQLGEVYRDQGDLPRAAALMREAVTLDPGPASYWNSLGMVLGAKGDVAPAEDAFRRALERGGPDAQQYAYNLGLALLQQGRRDEAMGSFRQSLSLDPSFAPARQRLADLGVRK
jgi:choline-sulfatase